MYDKSDDKSWIEGSGYVIRLLADDHDDKAHQRFIVQLPGQQTLLIANNLEISKRIPIGLSDRVQFRGVYEWNDLGGLVHWTHHDPHGKEDGGWIRHRRKNYS